MRVVAFMYLALLVIAIFTVRSRLKHTPSRLRLSDLFGPLRELPVIFLALASFFSFLGIFQPYNFLVLEAVHNGMSTRLAGYLLVILSATRLVPTIKQEDFISHDIPLILFTASSAALSPAGLATAMAASTS
jgi:hypothetical protein